MGEEAGFETINFDAILAEIDRKEADLRTAEQRLARVTAKACSADGLVEVTVSPTGAVTAVTLAPETFRRSTPQYLGRSVVEAAQQATRQVRQSAEAAVAPLAELGRELSEAIEEPRTTRSANAPAPTATPGTEAASTDRMARVGVNAMGIVAVVTIAPDAYHGGTVGKLAAAITEAAERAARQMYETRMGAIESEVDPEDLRDLNEFFPIHEASEQNTPPAPAPTPPPQPAPATPAPMNRTIPGTRKPNRHQVVGPSDWDEDDGYGQSRQSWLV